jgi:hypothetical protein
MQPSRSLIFISLTILYLTGGAFVAYSVVDKSIDYQRNMQAYAADMNYQERLLNIESWINGDGDAEQVERANRKKARAETEFTKARKYAWLMAAISLVFLVLMYALSAANSPQKPWRSLAVLTVALMCLIVGLYTPMLEIGAFEHNLSIPIRFETKLFSLNVDHTQVFEGDMYFYYQSKSIVELIFLLFKQNNWVVGISIFTFSLLIPFTKLLISFLHIWNVPFTHNPKLKKAMQQIAKWSMADVFVAAVFLAFLAFSNMEAGVQTQSRTLIGLYFFLSYVILSVWSGREFANEQIRG